MSSIEIYSQIITGILLVFSSLCWILFENIAPVVAGADDREASKPSHTRARTYMDIMCVISAIITVITIIIMCGFGAADLARFA